MQTHAPLTETAGALYDIHIVLKQSHSWTANSNTFYTGVIYVSKFEIGTVSARLIA